MPESVANTMATRYVTCLILGYILFVLQPNSQTLASPLSIGNFNVSGAVSKVGTVLNGAKNLLGFGQGKTTDNPPTTTKSPFYVILIPKEFSKKVNNATANETTTRVLTTPKPTKSNGFIQGTKALWEKAKQFGQKVWSKSTTPPPPRNVWIVPVNWSKLYATRPPCSQGQDGQGCLSSTSSSQLASFSWWTLSLSLVGALLMGIAAWVIFRRRWPGAGSALPDFVKVRPPKLPWPWYPSGPDCTAPRGPGAFPSPAVKTTDGGPLSAVRMTAGPPPSWPAPPVPAPASNRANSLYQTTPAAARNVYATPTQNPHSAWPTNANEHVHIYEIPPCFPSFDVADQEIDTSALKKAAFDTKQAKC